MRVNPITHVGVLLRFLPSALHSPCVICRMAYVVTHAHVCTVCSLHGCVHTVAVDVFSLCPVNVLLLSSSSSASSPSSHRRFLKGTR